MSGDQSLRVKRRALEADPRNRGLQEDLLKELKRTGVSFEDVFSGGALEMAKARFPVTRATMGLIEEANGGFVWDFDVDGGRPENVSSRHGLSGVEFNLYSWGGQIALERGEDLTGRGFEMDSMEDPDNGECYFGLYLGAHIPVERVRGRFVRRIGPYYWFEFTGRVRNYYSKPVTVELKTWIERQPDEKTDS